jgi:hypothetical protein
MINAATKAVKQARLNEIAADVKRLYRNPDITSKQSAHLERILDEGETIMSELETYQKACSMFSYASPEEHGYAGTNPGDNHNGLAFKGLGVPGIENQVRPASMFSMDQTQVKALQQAAQQRTPFKVTIGSKGIEHGNFGGGIRDKAALTESGMSPNLLPPIQQPGPGGWYGIPLELTRVENWLPNIAFQGPGLAYFRHDSDGANAGYVAEGTLKPDLSPVVSEQYVKPSKVAGRINVTHELVQDAGDQFAGKLATDLARKIYNANSNLLLNGTVSANGFAGINQVSGTLTRALDTANSESPLDTLNKAFVDLRNDFWEPDLVFVHPSTLGALRRLKDNQGRYILELLQGPRGINQTAEAETLWNVPCVQTTMQAAGTAAVLSVQSGAAVVYVRETLTTFFDPYSQISENIYQFVAENRLCLAIPRPGAISLVSGLPTS